MKTIKIYKLEINIFKNFILKYDFNNYITFIGESSYGMNSSKSYSIGSIFTIKENKNES